MLKTLLRHLGAYKKQAILAPITMILEVAMEVTIPFLMSRIINIGVANRDVAYITKIGLLMIGMALLSLGFGMLTSRLSSTAGAGFAKNLRRAMFAKIQGFSFSNIDRFSTASLVTRLTTDVTSVQNTFMMALRLAVRAPVMLVFAVIMAMSISADLATVFLVAVPILAATLIFVMSYAYPRFRKMFVEYDKMNRNVQEDLIGIRVVKAFVREDHETEKFREVSERVMKLQYSAERVSIWTMPVMMLVVNACMIAISWFGGARIINGQMLTGDLMSFISYTTQILMSLMMMGMVFMMIVITRASFTRIAEVLQEETDIVSPKNGIPEVPDGSVAYQDVRFRYGAGSGEPTLCDIDLSISAGQTVGVMGATGSAKTTLVQLIPRLYDVEAGSVLVGGNDVRDYDLKALRDSVAIVLQNNVLFSGTIRENLKWGNADATDEEIEKACRIAQAHEFILGFPNGYDTELGQGGVNLSGGQKQRLCIARALIKRPKIMILDDSTSAVDTDTDRRIREGLKRELAGMTTIIIAQRVASIMDADQIVVLDEGNVSAAGTHGELMQTSEIYREVFASQRKGVDEYAQA
ncbi:MAG TPA: ABC transporter ATP-binding protein [Feifaniaceae bacterium]|nr:ABC transporter ATP-binding protein [Feifaniaceae bacterium]